MSDERRITSASGGQKGQKLARFDLIDPSFLWGLAEVCGLGALKYSDDNWRKGYDWKLTLGALERHLNLLKRGQEFDEETGLHHSLHVAWHAMVLFVFHADADLYLANVTPFGDHGNYTKSQATFDRFVAEHQEEGS